MADDATATATETPEATATETATEIATAETTETATVTKEAATETTAAPDKYDIKLPENSPMPADYVEKTAARAREWGLSNEAAQDLVEVEHDAVTSYIGHQQAQLDQAKAQWIEECRKDPEFGGDKFAETSELAKRVIEEFGGTDEDKAALFKYLDESGLGQHPMAWRLFGRIGRLMANDSPPDASQGGAGADPKASLKGMYSKSPELFKG